ncbi:kinase-like domain-containing protein [Favolaschia claudopus]|uniref:non-specific serine/threonine protein kinase n=1 Tax=Favolaschia claudopus TaxID=2862362 RepID=A0AAV9ZB84_9AGAR
MQLLPPSIYSPGASVYIHGSLGPLDRGAYSDGKIYKGQDGLTGKVVAVRVIKAEESHGFYPHQAEEVDEGFAERMEQVAHLRHPHIIEIFAVQYHDAVNAENLIGRELMKGGTLANYIQRLRDSQWNQRMFPMSMPHDTCRDITYQICGAVDFLHAHGICHRNLNPETVLLTKHDPPFIKISSLGWIERSEPANMVESPINRSVAWYEYLAPETRDPAHNSNVRTDSWGVGMMAFRMLLLHTPWKAFSQGQPNWATGLRWDELELRLHPAPPPSELCIPETIPYEAKTYENGVWKVYGLSREEYDRLLREAREDKPSSNGLSLDPYGEPIPQRRLVGPDRSVEFEACWDLLQKLLRKDCSRRLSIQGALEHPWLAEHTPNYWVKPEMKALL